MKTKGRPLAAPTLGLCLTLTSLWGCRKKSPENTAPSATASATAAAPSASARAEAPPSPASSEEPTAPVVETPAGQVDWLAVGGGPAPESTEVSLEQDIELARKTLRGQGLVLFAGGTASLSVRELTEDAPGDELLVALGDLFSPRQGRSSRYRKPRLRAERATVENVEARLDWALSSGKSPLLVYVAAHGDRGERPRDNLVALWGNRALTVTDLSEIHERHARPLRVVMTSCFSGGFAELAFERADEERGPSRVLRCGLFAGPWDRQTSGCDANPDRRAHDSYGIHFLHALRKEDRAGKALPVEELDFDGDGVVGLLDAHTHARISAASFDVPTTTSERLLRKLTGGVERGSSPIDAKLLPEEAALAKNLGSKLALTTERAVTARWEALDARLAELDKKLDKADDAVAEAESALVARLLERWPVLDDPYHPDFARVLDSSRDSIRETLEASAEASKREDARRASAELDSEREALELEEARVARLKRAYETQHLAAALAKRGGRDFERYRALLACERAAP
jgi:hypothetical protein